MKEPCVYIMTNARNTVIYTGVTSDLFRRVTEHRSRETPGFTRRYNATKLVLVEITDRMEDAIPRENKSKPVHVKRKSI